MRFVLDNDVDAGVRRVLQKAGHDCWTAQEAGLADASDDAMGVYADNKDAVLITHDAGLAKRRRTDPIYGQVVRLRCPHPDAVEVMTNQLLDILDKLVHTEVVIRVTRHSVRIEAPEWLRDA